jgi:hypothetical protein
MPEAPSEKTNDTFNTFIYSLPSAFPFSKALEEANVITLPKTGKDPKFPQDLRPISILSTTSKLFEKVIKR